MYHSVKLKDLGKGKVPPQEKWVKAGLCNHVEIIQQAEECN